MCCSCREPERSGSLKRLGWIYEVLKTLHVLQRALRLKRAASTGLVFQGCKDNDHKVDGSQP